MGAQASATTFKSEALASLNAVTSSDVENDVDHSSCSAKTIGISANNTFSFVNAAGAKGYFRVTNITGTGNDRTATLDVLVQTVQ